MYVVCLYDFTAIDTYITCNKYSSTITEWHLCSVWGPHELCEDKDYQYKLQWLTSHSGSAVLPPANWATNEANGRQHLPSLL